MLRARGGSSLTISPPIRIVARGDLLEPGDHSERRRFAAARRSDQGYELSLGDLEVDRPHGLDWP